MVLEAIQSLVKGYQGSVVQVALFCPDYPPSDREGGIQDYSQRLARALCGQGVDVLVIAGKHHLGGGTDERVTVLKYDDPWDERWAHRVGEELKSRSVDIINLQYSPAMFENPHHLAWPTLAAKFSSIISFHTLWGGSKRNHLVALKLLRASHAVIATNSEILYLLRRYLPFFLKKAVFIPIGANITPQGSPVVVREAAARYGVSSDKCLLAYFGMRYPGKGLETLLGAAHVLRSDYQLDFQLLCIGGGVSDVDSYRTTGVHRAREMGLDDRICWTGRIPAPHVSALLSMSDIVVLPFASGASDRRGSLMAALAHGRPIVTTPPRIKIPHFVNRMNMFWPDIVTPKSIAQLIVQVHEDTSLQTTLREGALKLASKLSWEQIAKDTICCFERVIDASLV